MTKRFVVRQHLNIAHVSFEEIAQVEASYTGRFLRDLPPPPKPKARKRTPRKVATPA